MGKDCGCKSRNNFRINDDGEGSVGGGGSASIDDSGSSSSIISNPSGINIGSSLISSSRQSKSLGFSLGSDSNSDRSRTRSLPTISDHDSHIILRVSPPILHKMGVYFVIVKQQAFLVLGHEFIDIALEPLDCDLEIIIVTFSRFWRGSFCQHQLHLLFQLESI
jgi:hypothetical protein